MKNILENHAYGSTWGITCFYDDCEALLRQALDSGEDFLAEWGAKKEITFATVERGAGITYVEVRTGLDDLPDLVDTAVWRAFGGNDFSTSGFDAICKLHNLDPEKDGEKATTILEEIEDGVQDIYQEYFGGSVDLPRNASFDEIVEALERLESKAERDGHVCYDDIVDYIREWWDAVHEEADMNSGRYA